jgi:hypothetical protein
MTRPTLANLKKTSSWLVKPGCPASLSLKADYEGYPACEIVAITLAGAR